MSQISLKSISGITSITTPAGVDNQFTLHTNNTSQALKLDQAGNIHIHNHLNTTGVSTSSNFKTGSSNLHSTGLEVTGINVLGADTPIGAGATIFNSGDVVGKAGAEFQGIVTATSFVGDGLNLTNTGSALSEPSSGTHRLVTTNLTSGTMTSSGTVSTLNFNFATHTLSATNISGNLNATQLTSGTVPIARLGDSGTKSGSTFLAGDNTFKTVVVAINSISGDANNRIITSDGDGTATAESKLTFDGTTLQLGASTKLDLSTNDSYLNARVMRNESGGSDDGMYIGYGNANSGHTRIYGGGATSGGISVQGSGSGDCYINGNVIWNSGNDGSGTGLDSDTVDGIHGGSFLRSDADDTLTKGSTTVFSGGWNDWLVRFSNSNGSNANVYMCHNDHGMHIRNDSSTTSTYLLDVYAANGNRFRVRGADAYTTINGNQVWHAGNDGSGSGLDSDLLDGNQGSWYRDYNNLTNKPSTATVLYIDVYGQGNAGDRDTARNWATSAVSIPNNTMFVVRWNRVYSYWVNNNTASGNEDRKTLWIKNSSGSIYWAGADST